MNINDSGSLMTQEDIINQLKAQFHSDNEEIAQGASEGLVAVGGEDVTDFFISSLDQENAILRDRAAIALYDLADNKALEPLLKGIKKPENKNHCGTMAFALTNLDCSRKLVDLFELLFEGNAEVEMNVSSILKEQTFDYTEADLQLIKNQWLGIKNSLRKLKDLEEYQYTIEYFIDKYTASLQPPPNR